MKKLLLSAAVALMLSTATLSAQTAMYSVNVDRCDIIINTPRFEVVVLLTQWADGAITQAELREHWLQIFGDDLRNSAFIDRYVKGCEVAGLPT